MYATCMNSGLEVPTKTPPVRMLKTLWLLDAVLLAAALAMAFLTTGQDAAGRGILWFFPLVMAVGLGGSWLLDRGGSHRTAIALGLVAPLLAGAVFVSVGRSTLAGQREKGGGNYWDDRKLQKLAAAVSSGDTAAIRAAAAGVDVNAVGREGATPLTFAISHNPNAVPLLLELGANPNLTTAGLMSPLEQALNTSNTAFEMLLKGGANPNGRDTYGVPVLFSAIRSQRFDRYEALIAHGADVTLRDAEGKSSLMVAVGEQQWKIARNLLARGVDRTIVARDGTTLTSILERVSRNLAGDADYAAFLAELASRTVETR